MKRTVTGVVLVVGLGAVGIGVAGCSDDDERAVPTLESYCAELTAQPDEGGPFDEYFATYGEDPTLEDAAEGLPAVAASIDASADEFEAIEPADEAAEAADELVAALRASADTVEQGAAAAADGDQEEFDRLESENQEERVPAIMAAFEELADICGIEP